MQYHTQLKDIQPFMTKDGSEIRELMHPDVHDNQNQSLAQAVVLAGKRTRLHLHHKSEEIYFITQGQGKMTLGENVFDVNIGDAICIQPGMAHCIHNTGELDLHILCVCAPAYSHDDTELLEVTSQ